MNAIAATVVTMALSFGADASGSEATSGNAPPIVSTWNNTAQTTSAGVGGGCADCARHACHPQGCLLRKLFAWATYIPKERVCSMAHWCNSCQYKGFFPPYYFFLYPKCFEGGIVHPTFANECYRGCKGCGAP